MRPEIRRTLYRVHFADRRQELVDGVQLERAIREGRVGPEDRIALSDGAPRRYWEFPRFAALRPGNERLSGSGAELDATEPYRRAEPTVAGNGATAAVHTSAAHEPEGPRVLLDLGVRADAVRRTLDERAQLLARRLRTPAGTTPVLTDTSTGPSVPAGYRRSPLADVATGPSVPVRQSAAENDPASRVDTDLVFAIVPDLTAPPRTAPVERQTGTLPATTSPEGLRSRAFDAVVDEALRATDAGEVVTSRAVTRSRTAPTIAVTTSQVDDATRILRWVAAATGAVALYAIMQLFGG